MNVALTIAAGFEYGILILLFGLSIWSLAIMIDRRRTFARESDAIALTQLRKTISESDGAALRKWIETHPGVHAAVLDSAVNLNADPAVIDRKVRSLLSYERLRLEQGLSTLATLGANAPFMGLFGTVLGIIRAFAALGDASGGAATVMSGISQALVATAAGLFVAMPAVIAFNAFSNRVRTLLSQCDSLKDLYVAHHVRISKEH
jgi:biopolymer transport protein ExbB